MTRAIHLTSEMLVVALGLLVDASTDKKVKGLAVNHGEPEDQAWVNLVFWTEMLKGNTASPLTTNKFKTLTAEQALLVLCLSGNARATATAGLDQI